MQKEQNYESLGMWLINTCKSMSPEEFGRWFLDNEKHILEEERIQSESDYLEGYDDYDSDRVNKYYQNIIDRNPIHYKNLKQCKTQ